MAGGYIIWDGQKSGCPVSSIEIQIKNNIASKLRSAGGYIIWDGQISGCPVGSIEIDATWTKWIHIFTTNTFFGANKNDFDANRHWHSLEL